MTHAVFAVAFVAAPIAAWLIKRSLAWATAAVLAALAVGGSLLHMAIFFGHRWNWAQLEILALVALLVVVGAAWVTRPRGRARSTRNVRHQFLAIGLPIVILGILVIGSRLVAAPRSGLFTGVGFLMERIHAEDNAKWLDFTSRLVQGGSIDQPDALGGPLQLFMVAIADVLAALSFIFLGGLNEVFVMVNTVVYAEFGLVILAGLALTPFAEKRLNVVGGRSLLPLPLVWTGVAILTIASLAASGLGHITLQFTMIVAALWIAAFLVQSNGTIRSLAALGMVPVFYVWFPIAPLSLLVAVAAIVFGIRMLVRHRAQLSLAQSALWIVVLLITLPQILTVMLYLVEGSALSASPVGGAALGVVAAVAIPALSLLASQGGTEQAAAISVSIAAVSAVGATAYVQRFNPAGSRIRTAMRFGPLAALAGYAAILTMFGSWWTGTGPNYGALKTTFLATFVIAAVTAPLALQLLGSASRGTSAVQWSAIGAVIFLLAVDGILPRALGHVSPQEWPSVVGEDRDYWWPAEVRTEADQPIASLPIACTFRIDPLAAPSALPDGQPMYACTRLLVGMSGADYEALPIVNWLRREWFTNEPAWDPEYPGLSSVPEEFRRKNFILLDGGKQVIGLEPMQGFLDRFKPPWAQNQ